MCCHRVLVLPNWNGPCSPNFLLLQIETDKKQLLEKKKKAAVSVSMNTVFSMGHVTTKVIYEQLFYYGILPDN